MNLRRDWMAGHSACRLDHLADTETLAISQVEDEPFFATQRAERQEMCVCQVGDVDVIPDAGSVRCRIVYPEYFDRFTAAKGHIENQGNQVGLWFMGLATRDAVRPFGSSGNVEVPQRRGAQAVDPVHPAEYLLDDQLGFAIGIRG